MTAAGIVTLDREAMQACRRQDRDGDRDRLAKRLERLEREAAALGPEDPEWRSVRDRFVAWLRAEAAAATNQRPCPKASSAPLRPTANPSSR